MADASHVQLINDYWGRDGLEQAILDALAASGKHLDALTIDDLSPLDQFHGGGKEATVRLARAGRRNRNAGRIVMVQAVFDRVKITRPSATAQ
jgi:hypothetical protein